MHMCEMNLSNKRKTKYIKRYVKKRGRLICAPAIAMQADVSNKYTNNLRFDSDSGKVGIDNRCSTCMSHIIDNFEGPMTEYSSPIKGFGGTKICNVQKGTLVWRWMDNNGQVQKFTIPKSYYVPDGGMRLLSPQHWAKSQYEKGNRESRYGTLCQTTGDDITLYWDHKKKKLTVPLDT